MKKLTVIFLLITSVCFSQTINTKFLRDGYLKEAPKKGSNTIVKFKKNKDVLALDYVSGSWWKVQFKDYTGYIVEPFLIITDEMNEFKEKKDLAKRYEKFKNDSLNNVRASEQRRNELNSKKLIDSLKTNIISYAGDSLLIVNIREGVKLRSKAGGYGDVIMTTDQEGKGVVMDYAAPDGYFKICIDSKCGYAKGNSIRYAGLDDSDLTITLVEALKAKRERQFILNKIDNTITKMNKKKEIYYNEECDLSTNEIDEFSGKKRINTIMYNIDEETLPWSKLQIRLRKYGSSKFIEVITTRDIGCASSYSISLSYVKIKLENDDIITINHEGDIDCHNFQLIGTLSESKILRLEKSPIKTIRLVGTEKYTDFENIFFKEIFIKKLHCIK